MIIYIIFFPIDRKKLLPPPPCRCVKYQFKCNVILRARVCQNNIELIMIFDDGKKFKFFPIMKNQYHLLIDIIKQNYQKFVIFLIPKKMRYALSLLANFFFSPAKNKVTNIRYVSSFQFVCFHSIFLSKCKMEFLYRKNIHFTNRIKVCECLMAMMDY